MKFKLIVSIFFAALLAIGFARANDEDILKAMRDEIRRSMKELSIEGLEKPYYVEYKLTTKKVYDAKSSLGVILESDEFETASLNVAMRVGTYKFDNTNFFDFGLSLFGSGDDEERFKNRQVPVELNYDALRRELWLASDACYKQAAELLAKKKAALKNRVRKDTTHDFLKVEPKKNYLFEKAPEYDLKKTEAIVNSMSKVFSDYPDIQKSQVSMEYIPEKIYFVNSEGMEYVKTNLFTGLEVFAFTQAEDGMPVIDFYSTYGLAPQDLPAKDSLLKAAKKVADNIITFRKADELDDDYSGPVFFEDQAAAQMFAQIFAPNLVAQRPQLTENGVQDNDRHAAFQTKIGGRVLPEFLSVDVDPRLEKYRGVKTIGAFEIDDDGLESQKVDIVTDGYLKGLLSSRVPTKRVRKSNGHKRDGAPMLSVLKLSGSKDKTKPREENIKRMLELCEARELPYGIVVKKIVDLNIMYTTLFRIAGGDIDLPRGGKSQLIVEAYKVFPDGREIPIRGCETKGFSTASFKDILMIENDEYVMNYLSPAVVSPFVTGGDQYVPSTVIVPGTLFEDGEIIPPDADFPKPPSISGPK
jgi:TldD protein